VNRLSTITAARPQRLDAPAARSRRSIALLACLVGLSFAASGCQYTAKGKNAQGVAMFQNGQYQQSAQLFQQAIQQSPTDADAYYNLAATYHQVGKLNKSPNELSQAEALYNKALDLNPNNQEAYRALAVLLVDQNRPDAAQRLLDGWFAANPTNPAPKVELARLRDEFGDKQGAKDYLQQALMLDPYEPRALAALGRIQEAEGQTQLALNSYQRSLFRNASQPELAARVASLRTSVNASMQNFANPTFTSGGTRTATTPVTPLR
jgi:tetratricopeptide (TPR) repeat protein